MGARWRVEDKPGWDIEQITLGRRPVLRVRLHKSLIGYAGNLAELEVMLARWRISLADLVEVTGDD